MTILSRPTSLHYFNACLQDFIHEVQAIFGHYIISIKNEDEVAIMTNMKERCFDCFAFFSVAMDILCAYSFNGGDSCWLMCFGCYDDFKMALRVIVIQAAAHRIFQNIVLGIRRDDNCKPAHWCSS